MKNLKYFLNEPVLISLCLGFFCFLVSFVFQFTFIVPQGKEKIKRNFERVLHQKEKTAAGRLEQLRLSALTDSLFHVTKMEEDQQGISFFIYKNNALLYWSTNAIPVPDKTGQQEALFSERVKKLKNGWYEVLYTRDSVWQIVSLILLKHEYSFENEYLDNRFPEDFGIPAGTSLTLGRGDIRIQSYDGNALFSLNLPHKEVKSEFSAFFLFLLYLTGFLFLIAAIYFLYRKLQRRFPGNVLFFIGFIIDVLLLRFFLFYFRIPHIIYNTDLFGPGLFSTSNILPSLGDFLINSLLLLIISYVFFLQFPSASKGKAKSSLIRKILSFWYLLVIAGLAYITIRLARDLIFNSTIPFTLQNISALNGYSVLGLVIIACLFLSFFLVSVRLFSYAAELSRLDQHRGLKRFLFPKFNLAGILVYLVFFSIVGTILLDRTNSMLEKEKRKLIAMKLSGERDPVGELQFASEEDKLLKDPLLQKINSVIPDTSGSLIEDSITDYLENKYFKKGWGSYSIQITFCSNRKILRIQPQNYPMNCARYFQNIINGYGKPTLSRHLYFLDYGYGYRNYLAVIPVGSVPGNEDGSYNAYVEISSFLAYRDVGFPELLIDRKQNPVPDLSQYSYAFYRNGKLQHRVGKYQYSLDLDHAMTHRVKSDHFYSKDGISHYCHPVDDDTIFLLSKKEDTSLDKIAPFSYLFILFSLFSMFFSIIVRFPFFMRISMFRLGDRIQISMIGIMITSFLVIGILVVYYIIGLNSNKNIDNISDRTHSILVELQHKLGMEEELPPDSIQNLDELMMKYSNIFFSDVNLFAPDGRLLATSRPQLFEEGLISGRINRTAFTNLKYNHSSLYIHKETIGKLTYYSAYIPFFNERNSLLAYLNLPYFARQDDLKHEISAFLVAFINIYVFLIIVGIFIVLIVTNYISRPLRMLTSRIRQIAFGEKNQKLEWNRQDEIGRLVDEYNRDDR